jgi:hypothetical protein
MGKIKLHLDFYLEQTFILPKKNMLSCSCGKVFQEFWKPYTLIKVKISVNELALDSIYFLFF